MSWKDNAPRGDFDTHAMIRIMYTEITNLRDRVATLESDSNSRLNCNVSPYKKQDPTIKNENEGTTLDQLDSDHDAMLAIQELLDGVEWTPSTLDEIAMILVKAGYRVRDLNDVDYTEEEET